METKTKNTVELVFTKTSTKDLGFDLFLARELESQDAQTVSKSKIAGSSFIVLDATQILTNLLPISDDVFNVGSATKQWADGYFTGLFLSGVDISNIFVNVAGDTMTGALLIDGSANAVQLTVQGNGTQSALLSVWENSSGGDMVTISGLGAAVFNEQGSDADFRVEGDTDANLIFVDASADRVSIGDTTPDGRFTVVGRADENQLIITAHSTQTSLLSIWENSSGDDMVTISGLGAAVFNEQGSDADFRVEGDTDANLVFADASVDRVGIGTSSPGYKLDVNGEVNSTGYRVGGTAGVDGSFTTVDLKTVTVTKGIITSIV